MNPAFRLTEIILGLQNLEVMAELPYEEQFQELLAELKKLTLNHLNLFDNLYFSLVLDTATRDGLARYKNSITPYKEDYPCLYYYCENCEE